MASKHLYELEDVAATFLHAIHVGDPTTAIYAAKELHDSEEHDLLWNLLTLAWLLSDPGHPQQFNRTQAFYAKDYETLLLLLVGTTEHPLPPVAAAPTLPLPPKESKRSCPESWHPLPKHMTAAQASTFYTAVTYSIKKKFWEHASYLLQCLLTENTLSVSSLLRCLGVEKTLTDMLETTVYTPLALRIVDHACASLVAAPIDLTISNKYKTLWNTKLPKGRAGRLLTIQGTALATWRLKSKPVERLMGVPLLITEASAAAYWANALNAHNVSADGHELLFADDEQTEAFYTNYFPDDISDEWSCAERAKSHGLQVPVSENNPWLTAFLLCWS
jgi:hypothetical protein